MQHFTTPDGNLVYDVLGIGFGPANLALAIALEEEAEAAGKRRLRWLFLERQPGPVWHSGMLIEDSLIQITVLKDLATLRNPRSRFTFLNYLKVKGRLLDFLNLRDLFPTRVEFNDYLCWAAAQLRDRVLYGQEVIAISPVPGKRGEIELLEVAARDTATGRRTGLRAANVVLATGGVPCLPPGIELRPGGPAFHSDEAVPRLERDFPDPAAPYRFVVVGSGQSGAELFHHLITRYRHAEVTAAIRRYAYKPVDDSHFTNEIFYPDMVDQLYGLPEEKRRMVLDDCRDVNYAVVDAPLIRQIYKLLYQQRVLGRQRARLLPYHQLEAVSENARGVLARFRDLLHERDVVLAADGLILCTGYAWRKEHPLLAEVAPWLERDAAGAPRVLRDYRLASRPAFAPGVFVQGFAEDTHGASETVLSLLPVRAGDILESVLAILGARESASRDQPIAR
jgi:L-ornithine N5-monooxygenase